LWIIFLVDSKTVSFKNNYLNSNIVYNIHSNGNKNLSLTNSIKEAVLNSFIDQCQSDVNTCKNRYFGDSDIEKESTKKSKFHIS